LTEKVNDNREIIVARVSLLIVVQISFLIEAVTDHGPLRWPCAFFRVGGNEQR
jgi:hypothetical protein